MESKKNDTLIADDDAGIHERFVFGSMWNTCALHVKIGCSLCSTQKSRAQFSIYRHFTSMTAHPSFVLLAATSIKQVYERPYQLASAMLAGRPPPAGADTLVSILERSHENVYYAADEHRSAV